MRIIAVFLALALTGCSTADWVINGTSIALEGVGFVSRTIDDPNPNPEPKPIEDK